MSVEQIRETEWYQTRPPAVQQRIDACPPTQFYRLKTTGQIVPIYSYEVNHQGECNTCKVQVLRQYNPEVVLDRTVFNVPFENLEAIEKQGG